MSTWLIALIIGLALGLAVAVLQHHRVSSFHNPLAVRYPDGSLYGGHWKVLFGVALLWTAVGFGIAFPIVASFRPIVALGRWAIKLIL